MQKKKISFDIDEDDFKKIKILIEKNNMGQGEFLRKAIKKMIESFNEKTLNIFIAHKGNIELFVIEKNDYEINMWDASSKMKTFVCAKKEGEIKCIDSRLGNKELNKIIEENGGTINFFTK